MKKILLLHGALGAAEQLKPLADQLEASFQVRIFEFPGHGQTPVDGSFRIERFAEALEVFVRKNALEDAHVFGYSMGGYVALYLASQGGGLFRSVMTLATKFDWSPEIAAREVGMLDPDKIQTKVPAFAQLLQDRHGPDRWRQLCADTVDSLLALGERPLLTPDRLARLPLPVHIGWGDADRMVTREESERVAQALPRARFHVLPQTPHPYEQVSVARLRDLILEQWGE